MKISDLCDKLAKSYPISTDRQALTERWDQWFLAIHELFYQIRNWLFLAEQKNLLTCVRDEVPSFTPPSYAMGRYHLQNIQRLTIVFPADGSRLRFEPIGFRLKVTRESFWNDEIYTQLLLDGDWRMLKWQIIIHGKLVHLSEETFLDLIYDWIYTEETQKLNTWQDTKCLKK